MRLEQRTINSFKHGLEDFLPHYWNSDMTFPDSLHYEFGTFFYLFKYTLDWTDIKFSEIDMDIKDVKIDLQNVHFDTSEGAHFRQGLRHGASDRGSAV